MKPVLVFLSGWGFEARIWAPWVSVLSADWTCVCLDLPGFGTQAEAYCKDMDAVISWLLPQLPPAAVYVGWSLGGLVVSAILAREPQRVRGVMGLATAPCFTARDGWSGMPMRDLQGFMQLWQADPQRAQRRFASLVAGRQQRLLRDMTASWVTPAHWQWGLLALQTADYREACSTECVPQLYVFASGDQLLPAAVAADCQRCLPQASVSVLSGGHHALPVSAMAALVVLFKKYFSQVVDDVSA